MPTTRRPRKGSLGMWPRVRSRKEIPRVRSWADRDDTNLLGFAGYKAGMTTLIVTENNPNSKNKGKRVPVPVTILECPPMRIASIRFYGPLSDIPIPSSKSPSKSSSVPLHASSSGVRVVSEIFAGNDARLLKRLGKAKKVSAEKAKKALEKMKSRTDEFTYLTLLVHTQPALTGIGKKVPDLMEIALSGTIEEQIAFAEERLGKDIKVEEVLSAGMQVDAKAVTKGKGFQGTTKRYGTKIRTRKSEKAKRGTGNVGAWHPAKVMYTVPQPGKMGYHARTDYNKQILLIGDSPDEVNLDGGFIRYGEIRSSYLAVKGSVPGPAKRLIRLNLAVRPNRLFVKEAPEIQKISKRSPQGN